MTLPDLALQFVYGRLGWAIVLATIVIALWRRSAPVSRAALGTVVAASFAAMALPGALSPAWWLGLAFQYPSGVLVGLCLMRLAERWNGVRRSQVMSQTLAGVLAVAGALVYLDASGVLASGLYFAGFGGAAMPALAVIAAAACALAIARDHGRATATALLGAIVLFSVLRLPTGNLWDTLLDPLLWCWAVFALLAAVLRRAGRRASDRIPEATPAPGLLPAVAEPFSSLKEQVGGK